MPNSEHVSVRSESVQDILSAVPNWMIRWGNTLVFIIIMGLFTLSYLVQYPDIITSEVMITTLIPPEKIHARFGGRIDTLLIKDKSLVLKNQDLAVLENSADYKDVLLLKQIIDSLDFDYKQPYFPVHQLPRLSLGDIDIDYALFERNYMSYQLNKKLQPFANEFIAHEMSIMEAKERLNILLSQEIIHLKELEFKKKELKRNKTLYEEGVISSTSYEQKQLDMLREERAYQNIKTTISQIRENLNNQHKNLKGNEIKQAQEENRIIKEVIQAYSQLKKSIRDWELQYVLKSSIAGKVTFLSIWNQHQTIQANDLVFTIIPHQNTSFIGKIKAPIQSSGKIKRHQKVHIRLANYPHHEFGILHGHIKDISLMPNQEGYYLIDVALPKTLVTTYRKKIEFKQEMRGSADIITEDLRLIERFFYQLRQILV